MLMENRMRGNAHVRLGGGPGETERIERPPPRLWPTQSSGWPRPRAVGGAGRRGARRRARVAERAGARRDPARLQGHMSPEDVVTVAEIAEILKLNPQTVRNWIDQGSLPAIRIGRRVRVRW